MGEWWIPGLTLVAALIGMSTPGSLAPESGYKKPELVDECFAFARELRLSISASMRRPALAITSTGSFTTPFLAISIKSLILIGSYWVVC
jgi:hypothetical protein